jgi:myosin heavy subunit
MDKIAFEREKFRCGHTMVFFRAGALAALEEARDGIVLKLIRWMQGEVYGRVKRAAFQKKSDQRELMKVIQRNFRKYATLRNWGWFVIIQKTKPLIGRINLEDELRMLEEAAVAKFGAYEEQLKTKDRLGEENELIKEETKALIKQLESEQGNLSQYTDQQERASKAKADYEQKLVAAGQKLIQMEEERVQATADKKSPRGRKSYYQERYGRY